MSALASLVPTYYYKSIIAFLLPIEMCKRLPFRGVPKWRWYNLISEKPYHDDLWFLSSDTSVLSRNDYGLITGGDWDNSDSTCSWCLRPFRMEFRPCQYDPVAPLLPRSLSIMGPQSAIRACQTFEWSPLMEIPINYGLPVKSDEQCPGLLPRAFSHDSCRISGLLSGDYMPPDTPHPPNFHKHPSFLRIS